MPTQADRFAIKLLRELQTQIRAEEYLNNPSTDNLNAQLSLYRAEQYLRKIPAENV